MDNVKLNPEARQRIVGAIDAGRAEFTKLIGLVNQKIPDKDKLKSGVKELQELLENRILVG
jgi:hypothetical protein